MQIKIYLFLFFFTCPFNFLNQADTYICTKEIHIGTKIALILLNHGYKVMSQPLEGKQEIKSSPVTFIPFRISMNQLVIWLCLVVKYFVIKYLINTWVCQLEVNVMTEYLIYDTNILYILHNFKNKRTTKISRNLLTEYI